ncbi:MAG: phosphomannose isomerase type II C-terminal cupin domain [Candidatus Taylorbacteria bacterium]
MEKPKPFTNTRPWGAELWLTKNSPSMVKIITVQPGESCSLQYHHHRDEYWRVLSGNGSVVIGTETVPATVGEDYFVPRETRHRFTGGTEPLVLLEIIYGEFDEMDIVRLEDRYGRV